MAKIAFVTFGCSVNQSDTELMKGLLSREGHEIVDSADDSVLVVINGCTVKAIAEKKFFKAIEDAKSIRKQIVIAGCVTQADNSIAIELSSYSIVGTRQLNNIVHVVEETLAGNVVHMLGQSDQQRLNLPRIRRNKIVGIVPISEGCLGECTYCKTRLARGRLKSYDPDAIINHIRSDVQDGCKEIWLTSQDCGAYGKDIGTDIATLLRSVLKIRGDFRIRLGMANPNHVLEHLEELIEIYASHKEKLFWFLHIPVQSGSDRILTAMRREYMVSDFINIVDSFREKMPEISIWTDIICGFPGETEDEFKQSLELIKRIKPDVLNISRFWARPGTPAATMDSQLHGRETNIRSRRMRDEFGKISLERNLRWVGWKGDVIVDELGPNGGSIGRNYAYKPVATRLMSRGERVHVEIAGAQTFYLESSLR